MMLAAPSFPANFSLSVADNFLRLFALGYYFCLAVFGNGLRLQAGT